jgi:hypothetical protein
MSQTLSYNVAVCGVVLETFSVGAAGLAAAEAFARDVASTLTPTATQSGETFAHIVTVDQMVGGVYFGEASRFAGTKQ